MTAPGLSIDLDIVQNVPGPVGEADLRTLVHRVLASEQATGAWTIAVVLTDDAHLRALHRDFMGIDAETDVMTFPLGDAAAPAGEPRGGDVIVSVERATEQAASFGLTPADEVRFLVVHGLLHLLGWTDDTEEARRRMLQRQAELLALAPTPD